MQQYSVLQTKLYIPPIRRELVSRPHLIERLNAGLHRKLTLISAPAGFGKTTLVTQWLKGAQCPSTWLSLDESDNDPTRFLTYLVAALQTNNANIGGTAVQESTRWGWASIWGGPPTGPSSNGDDHPKGPATERRCRRWPRTKESTPGTA
jgi:ATP/maltotriose-dependent transcriptional regulator MalT